MIMLKTLFAAVICTISICNPASALMPKNLVSAPKNSILEQISNELNQIATSAMPATVYIKTQTQSQQNDPFQNDFFKNFFGNNMPQQQQQPQFQQGGGSGFLIREDGYIVTNNHVVKDVSEITVVLNDGREYIGTVKGTDPRTDLAVVKIEEKGLPFLLFGDSDTLKVGEIVIAIGNPFGLEASLTMGVVSAKGRQDLGIASFEDFIQTDAAINPGNSGGPLLNPQGEVIGVNTAIMSRTGGYMGIGLSIPSKMVQNVIDQIVEGGSVKRAYLGIIMQPIDKGLAEALGLEKQDGLVISEVVKDSPASKAGLLQGDIIIAYNDKPIRTISKFRHDIAMMQPATKIKLTVLRNSKQITIPVELGSATENEIAAGELGQKLGLELENMTQELASKFASPDTDGVLVTNIKPNSLAAKAGLQKGFVITHIAFDSLNNPNKVSNLSDMEQALKESGDKKYLILIARYQNYQRYYTIKIN
jgi:serine protease Do